MSQMSTLNGRLDRLNEIRDEPKPTSPELEALKPTVRLYVQSSPDEKRIILTQLFKEMWLGDDGVAIEYM